VTVPDAVRRRVLSGGSVAGRREYIPVGSRAASLRRDARARILPAGRTRCLGGRLVLTRFFFTLREAGIPVSITEHLTLLKALEARVAGYSVDDFYYLARATMVKDEKHFDRFDRAFAAHFRGIESAFAGLGTEIPAEWLKEADRAPLHRGGEGADRGARGLRATHEDPRGAAQGAEGPARGATSGSAPAAPRPSATAASTRRASASAGRAGQRRASKVWEKREYRNLDDTVQLGTRNIKVALRKLRRFAREGAEEEFDLDGTISSTARNAGLLDLKFQPERHNAIKLLLFLDVGGSMESHVRGLRGAVLRGAQRVQAPRVLLLPQLRLRVGVEGRSTPHGERTPTLEILRTYPKDYRVIFVGDASMSPYEILQPGGSIEHWNDEAGAAWMQRITERFHRHAWLNPSPRTGGLHRLDRDHAPAPRRADVPAHRGGSRPAIRALKA